MKQYTFSSGPGDAVFVVCAESEQEARDKVTKFIQEKMLDKTGKPEYEAKAWISGDVRNVWVDEVGEVSAIT